MSKTEHPILFTGPMVQAILDGRKTQTRRVIKPQPVKTNRGWEYIKKKVFVWLPKHDYPEPGWRLLQSECPYGLVGHTLWVRETHRAWFPTGHDGNQGMFWDVRYRADNAVRGTQVVWDEGPEYLYPEDVGLEVEPTKWTPSIFMNRCFARIILEVTEVRVERVQDITKEGIEAEGVAFDTAFWRAVEHPVKKTLKCWETPERAFKELWNSINGNRGFSWDTNCWVWVVSFKRLAEIGDPE